MSIHSRDIFVRTLGSDRVLSLGSFQDFLTQAENAVRRQNPAVTQNALNNVRGNWYEWLIGIGLSEYWQLHPVSKVMVPLPNISGFDCEDLYISDIADIVKSLKKKVSSHSNVSLITSNPDFAIIMRGEFQLWNRRYPVTISDLDHLDKAYSHFVSRCSFDDIIGYASVKASVRPDRRLQIPHEGSLMKALYRHIQTREWNINARGLQYYGISTAFTAADRKALKTVATHSLVSVHSPPEPAVDALFVINSGHDLEQCIRALL